MSLAAGEHGWTSHSFVPVESINFRAANISLEEIRNLWISHLPEVKEKTKSVGDRSRLAITQEQDVALLAPYSKPETFCKLPGAEAHLTCSSSRATWRAELSPTDGTSRQRGLANGSRLQVKAGST
ncbi:uncharacterized protein LOC112565888 isoform X2 [Pomacea canaliculata]|uniref:uncharacterized protein LOC112565888 isoform X2 n=1 Tax=Pomacea canaliculata TaxID=400727 RepID=UPI000D72A50E|nr:uncharacterized protein LOC112565888 isoform X2 [Pomacea canaliculata]